MPAIIICLYFFHKKKKEKKAPKGSYAKIDAGQKLYESLILDSEDNQYGQVQSSFVLSKALVKQPEEEKKDDGSQASIQFEPDRDGSLKFMNKDIYG